MVGWLVVHSSPNATRGTSDYRWNALHGGLSKGSQPVFTRFSEKTTENFKRLGQQARPGNDPSTSCLQIFECRTLNHCGSKHLQCGYPCLTRDSNQGSLVQQLTPKISLKTNFMKILQLVLPSKFVSRQKKRKKNSTYVYKYIKQNKINY